MTNRHTQRDTSDRPGTMFAGATLTDEAFVALVMQYLDGVLAPDLVARLTAALAVQPRRVALFNDICLQAVLLREYGAGVLQSSPLAARPEAGCEAPDACLAEVPRKQFSRWLLGRRRQVAALALFAAVALAVAANLLWRYGRDPVLSLPIATLGQFQGDVGVASGGKTIQTVVPGTGLPHGSTVEARGAHSHVELNYADGTSIVLLGSTSVTLSGDRQKYLFVREGAGTVVANVAPQPRDRPMVLETSVAKAEVLGTRLSLSSAAGETDLSVIEGRVRVTRVTDGASVEVAQGEHVVAGDQPALVVEDIPAAPDTWSAEFEHGLPQRWLHGRFTAADLPRGSQGAAAATRVEIDGQTYYQIASPLAWVSGLFAIHDDSHLHFTFKMDRPDWINVFFLTRTLGGSDKATSNHLFNETPRPSRPGAWRTVAVPLATFQRISGDRANTGDQVPFLLWFSAPEPDRGLVIDRVWVTRGGPGRVEVKDLD